MTEKYFKIIGLIVYGLILSGIIGFISSVFLILVNGLTDFLWTDISNKFEVPSIYTLLLCIFGGVLVGVSRYKWGNLPKTANDAIVELKTTQRIDYSYIYINFLVAFLILIFGASVGPAAAILSSVIALSVWQGDKMRYYYFSYNEWKKESWLVRLKKLALPHNYLIPYNPDRAPKEKKLLLFKKLLYMLFIVNGMVTFMFLIKISDQPPFVTKLGESSWGLDELFLFIPFVLFGILFSKLYELMEIAMNKFFSKMNNKIILSSVIGGIGIGLMSLIAPNLLFSGQLSMLDLPSLIPTLSITILILGSVLKLIFMEFCLKSGWIGGNVLPVIFASILQGYAIATLFPQLDMLFIVAVIGSSASIAILKTPLLVGLALMLFFPKELAPIILIIVVLFILLSKMSKIFPQKITA
ncbi:chloride ion channel protein [Siminovitchia terrae]|uniref:Chloride ion channel protein n=1 Tax=Siminovitchia terrae TaxID=1914933 RepID=A0ABQ4KSW8_SIMTE|nr:chloride channel protein [Siminovitchia terrae]GIN91286.1 chloride ion channel protein [Siminovitchia terrae]GIN94767.1 chloride ion channel protein [Siminovitchia terrae]